MRKHSRHTLLRPALRECERVVLSVSGTHGSGELLDDEREDLWGHALLQCVRRVRERGAPALNTSSSSCGLGYTRTQLAKCSAAASTLPEMR